MGGLYINIICHLHQLFHWGFITKAESIKIDKTLIKFNSKPEFHHSFPGEQAKIPEDKFT